MHPPLRLTSESVTVSLHSTGSSKRLDRAVLYKKKLNACYERQTLGPSHLLLLGIRITRDRASRVIFLL